MSKRIYWLFFAASQICGCIVPLFGNVHMNILPIAIGIALLFPGIFAENIPSIDHLPTVMMFAVVILLNAAAWYLMWKILRLDSPRGPMDGDPPSGNFSEFPNQ
jgi:hypothetical protein